ncbi:hypothetical protein [Streptomyces sp. XD-27]|uniref:hypothetical protein n=1 Tax=Streptomyces sp. XD-27 TaxID=3062779 RepID=UPI0026F40FD1|nr:hypothetical protein [Streptomyces sp. XD-27]WKX70916.1 hypothetical protein Q3Y56_14280 [Streptomyces sp. XD-27]
MRKLASLLAVAAMTGATLFTTGAASAGSLTPAKAPTTAAKGGACDKGMTLKAKESVKIRASKRLNSTARGLFPKGGLAKQAKCGDEKGQSYDLCGWEKNLWTYLDYRGTKGWVPAGCTLTGW